MDRATCVGLKVDPDPGCCEVGGRCLRRVSQFLLIGKVVSFVIRQGCWLGWDGLMTSGGVISSSGMTGSWAVTS